MMTRHIFYVSCLFTFWCQLFVYVLKVRRAWCPAPGLIPFSSPWYGFSPRPSPSPRCSGRRWGPTRMTSIATRSCPGGRTTQSHRWVGRSVSADVCLHPPWGPGLPYLTGPTCLFFRSACTRAETGPLEATTSTSLATWWVLNQFNLSLNLD